MNLSVLLPLIVVKWPPTRRWLPLAWIVSTKLLALLAKAGTTAPVDVLTSAMSFTAVPSTEVKLPPMYASEQLPFAKAMVFTSPLAFGFQPVILYGAAALKLK